MPEGTEDTQRYLLEGCQVGMRYGLARSRSAPAGTAGSQLARLAGESLEFMDHRDYLPGDDLRRLDWAASARADRLIVKLYRQELTPHLDLVLDASRSMGEPTAKLRATVALAAALATAAAKSSFSRKVFLAGDDCRPVAQSTAQPTAWAGLDFDGTTSPTQALLLRRPALRAHGIRVLLSDLLWLEDPLGVLSMLAHKSAGLFVLQVLSRDELEPAHRGNLKLVDTETGELQEVFFDELAMKTYRENLQRHQDHWRLACRQVGATMVTLEAEPLCAGWDLAPLVAAQLLTA
jgi:uncharacterized protein (DUF58 family)